MNVLPPCILTTELIYKTNYFNFEKFSLFNSFPRQKSLRNMYVRFMKKGPLTKWMRKCFPSNFSKRIEEISQRAQRPAMDRFWDIRDASDENYIFNIFIIYIHYIIPIIWNLPIRMCIKKLAIPGLFILFS